MNCGLHEAARVAGAEEEQDEGVAGDAVGEPVREDEGREGLCRPMEIARQTALP